MRWSARRRSIATRCGTPSPRPISPTTSSPRTRSASTTPARTRTPCRRCCRCRTGSRPWWGRRATPRPSRCSPCPSGRDKTRRARALSGLLLQAVVSGLLLGGVYGLVASGLTLIFGVLRIINFAHGAVMMLAMYASYWLWVWLGMDPYLSVLLTAPAFFVLGMAIQRAVIEPNRAAAEHNQLLLTLGLALFLENLALVLWQGDFRTLKVWYSGASFMLGDALVELPRLIAACGAVLMAAGLFGFLRLTDTGKAIRALAEEPEGAMLVGIDVARIRAVAFGIGAEEIGRASCRE